MLRTLKGRTALAAAVLSAIGIVVVTSLQANLSERTLLAANVAQHDAYTYRAAADLDKQLRLARSALSEFASNLNGDHLGAPSALHHYVSMAVGLQERFESIKIYSLSGQLLASRPAMQGPPVTEETWFRTTIANSGVSVLSDPFVSPLSGASVVVMTYPVYDEAGTLRAVLAAALSLKHNELWTAPPAGMEGETGFILLTAGRTIALHPDPALVGKPLSALGRGAAPIERGLSDPQAPRIGDNHRGVRSLYSFRKVSMSDWALIGVTANEAASASLARLSNQMLLAGGVLATLLFPAMWLLVSRMLRPLDHLRGEMKRLRGKAAGLPQVHRGATHEIAALTDEFVALAGAWRSAEAALQREKERAEVTLQSIAEGVVATDREGRIVAMNGAAASLTGWHVSDAVGRPFVEVFVLLNEKSGEPLADLAIAAMQDGHIKRDMDAQLSMRSGELIPVHNAAAPIHNMAGDIDGAVIVFRNVSSEREAAQQLEWRATHDSMTGLVNRHAYEQELQRVCTGMRPREHHALVVLDLDQFKLVNDTCGHAAGDALLKELAGLFLARCRISDLVARLGGDEFAVLMYRCSGAEAARAAEELLEAVTNHRFEWDGRVFGVGASIGVVEINASFNDPAEVVKAADMAAYMAKRSGGTRICNHSGADEALHAMRTEMTTAATIRAAIEGRRLRLYAQSIRPAAAKSSGHYFEILARMLDERGVMLEPGSFLPAAERYGLMRQIDRWIIAESARALAEHFGPDRWHELNTASINLSAITLKDPQIGDFILEELRRHSVPLGCICFEITETAAIECLVTARALMQRLRGEGVRFALDDFGVGMTSLSQLRDLPIDVLKIDGSFITGINQDGINGPLVDAIQSIARKFSMVTVAERVETLAEFRHLCAIGIDYAQGHLLARPTPLHALIAGEAARPRIHIA